MSIAFIITLAMSEGMYRVPSTRTFFRHGHLVRQLPPEILFAPSLHARKQSQGLEVAGAVLELRRAARKKTA